MHVSYGGTSPEVENQISVRKLLCGFGLSAGILASYGGVYVYFSIGKIGAVGTLAKI